jgi:hypothetical protein
MGILEPKHGPKQDFSGVKEIKKEDNKTINALPDFEIRTMKDDLTGLGVKRVDKSLFFQAKIGQQATPGGIAPAVPRPTIPSGETTKKERGVLENTKSEFKSEFPKKEESGMIVPENLPVASMFKKSALPSTEELIRKKEESPLAPLPPREPETFFEEEAPTPEKIRAKTAETSELPQMEKLKIPEPIYAPEKEGIRKILKLATIGVFALALIGAGAFVYFKNRTSIEPEPEPVIKVEPQLSIPIVSVEEKKILSLINGKNLFQLLREEAKTEQKTQTFKYIGALKNETEFLSLGGVMQNLEIPISPYVSSELKNNYNLFIFNQETGKRIGIIIEINNPENLKTQMKTWEPAMLDDFKNFYPIQAPGQAASKNFLDDNYKNVIIRYKNLPYPTLTLNYTILSNFLVIGTSKELMYSTIDRILTK